MKPKWAFLTIPWNTPPFPQKNAKEATSQAHLRLQHHGPKAGVDEVLRKAHKAEAKGASRSGEERQGSAEGFLFRVFEEDLLVSPNDVVETQPGFNHILRPGKGLKRISSHREGPGAASKA